MVYAAIFSLLFTYSEYRSFRPNFGIDPFGLFWWVVSAILWVISASLNIKAVTLFFVVKLSKINIH